MTQQSFLSATGGVVREPYTALTSAVGCLLVCLLALVAAPAALAEGGGPVPCATSAACDDGDVCTDDVCRSGECLHLANSAGCDDGVGCTIGDVCAGGVCAGTPSCAEGEECHLLIGVCQLVDGDNDGLADVNDPCVDDARNRCYGPVASDARGELRINANVSGAECYGTKTDCNGDVWYRDAGYSRAGNAGVCGLDGGGEGCVIAGIDAIFGCDDEETEDLFQCGHFDAGPAPELWYGFALPDNDYLVNLYFANTFRETSAVGTRVFDILLEGATVYDDFDQVAAAGASATAVVRTAIVSVIDGTLDIGFGHEIENPALKAIEVLAAGECITDGDCDDGDACNGVESCQAWTCAAGTAPVCDDGLFCNGAEWCDAGLGCQAGEVVDCGDGVDCTVDGCDEDADACVSTASDAMCDNGAYCDGAEVCDGQLGCMAGQPVDCNDGIECTVDGCDETADACVGTASDALCDNAEYCDGAEVCDAQLGCTAGPAIDCNDGVECTVDGCNETADGCDHVATDSLCDDGTYCNGAETCDAAGGCEDGKAIDCNDGVECTVDSCNEDADGCDNLAADALCDDGSYCNGAETCDAAGGCEDGEAVVCDDDVECTEDSCNEDAEGCDNLAADVLCDDGGYCNGAETCDAASGCQAAEAVSCDDGVDCTVDGCNEDADACDNLAFDAMCDDGSFCNGAETCDAAGGCITGETVECDDGIDCTADGCNDETRGCDFLAADAFCDDGAYCNGLETCNASTGCVAGSTPCDDGVPCTVDGCDEDADSCSSAPSDAVCDDGLFCNGLEVCDVTGGCVTDTPAPDCGGDDTTCGVGMCDEELQGCVVAATNEGGECSDGDDACTLDDVCADSQCSGIPLCDPECQLCKDGECFSLCGNPYASTDNLLTVVDSLFTIRAAVELEECPMCVCDVNGDNEINVSDSLVLMRYVVGLDEEMSCPGPGSSTTTTMSVTTSTVTSTTLLFD